MYNFLDTQGKQPNIISQELYILNGNNVNKISALYGIPSLTLKKYALELKPDLNKLLLLFIAIEIFTDHSANVIQNNNLRSICFL